jgi:hypothetical protein
VKGNELKTVCNAAKTAINAIPLVVRNSSNMLSPIRCVIFYMCKFLHSVSSFLVYKTTPTTPSFGLKNLFFNNILLLDYKYVNILRTEIFCTLAKFLVEKAVLLYLVNVVIANCVQ